VKFWVVLVPFARSSCLEFVAGYRRLDRPLVADLIALGPWVKFWFSPRFSGS
jgi:hypothetical protein